MDTLLRISQRLVEETEGTIGTIEEATYCEICDDNVDLCDEETCARLQFLSEVERLSADATPV